MFLYILFIINILFVQIPFIVPYINDTICKIHTNNYKSGISALILARGGSKGIPRKNLVEINGISLLGRALITLHDTNVFSEIWVSTEDDEIIKEAIKYGAFIHKRPAYLALDDTTSIAAVREFLSSKEHIKSIALIQCTSIFLRSEYLKSAYDLFKNSDCVFSVTRSHKLRWNFVNNEYDSPYVKPLNFDPYNRPRRQDWEGELIENGMFYFAKKILIKRNIFQNRKCKVIVIPEAYSLEIDKVDDLRIAEYLIEIFE